MGTGAELPCSEDGKRHVLGPVRCGGRLKRSKPPAGGSVVVERKLTCCLEKKPSIKPHCLLQVNFLCVDYCQRLCSASRLERGEDGVFAWRQPASEFQVQMHGEMYIWGHTHTHRVRSPQLEGHSPNLHVVTVGKGAWECGGRRVSSQLSLPLFMPFSTKEPAFMLISVKQANKLFIPMPP